MNIHLHGFFILFVTLSCEIEKLNAEDVGTAQCVLEQEEENIVSAYLEGSWVTNAELNQILSNGDSYVGELRFNKNDSIVDLIPEDICLVISEANSKIYMAGTFSYLIDGEKELDRPFFLSSWNV